LAPENLAGAEEPRGPEVRIIYTTEAGTRRALERAWTLAQDLRAHVRLDFIYSVPYTLPLTAPAISLPFLREKLERLAKEFPGEASVHIHLARDVFQALQAALPQSSLIVLGGRRGWFPTKEQRLERRLKKLGHQVLSAESR